MCEGEREKEKGRERVNRGVGDKRRGGEGRESERKGERAGMCACESEFGSDCVYEIVWGCLLACVRGASPYRTCEDAFLMHSCSAEVLALSLLSNGEGVDAFLAFSIMERSGW